VIGCAVVLVAASISIAAALSGSSAGTGTVRGVYKGIATRMGGPGRPSAGDLIFTGRGKTYDTTASSDGRFSISLPPGTYDIAGWGLSGPQSPGISGCQAVVKVLAGVTSDIVVNCVFH